MTLPLRLAFIYFACVFGAGFLLGVARVLWLIDLVGERSAELYEMPFMVLICAVAASFILRRRCAALSLGGALLIGAVALFLLLAVEFSVVLYLRGLTLESYLASRDPVSGIAYVIGLLWYALAPVAYYLIKRRSAE